MSENEKSRWQGVTLYDWVPFFKELCEKIAEIGEKPEQERDTLMEAYALKIFEKGQILKFLPVNPFSLVYYLASKNTGYPQKGQRFYEKAKEVFNISADIPTDWTYPTPPSLWAIFATAKTRSEEVEGLWSLFKSVVRADRFNVLSNEDFVKYIGYHGIGLSNFTQALFLFNPNYFLPLDKHSSQPLFLKFQPGQWKSRPILVRRIKEGKYPFHEVLNDIYAQFPGCSPFEINFFSYMYTSKGMKVGNFFFQINVSQKDFQNFRKNNYIQLDGSKSKTETHSLTEPKMGDVILMCTDTKHGQAIGIVLDNEHERTRGEGSDAAIKVIFINAQDDPVRLANEVPSIGNGINKASLTTIQAFQNVSEFQNTLNLIETLKEIEIGNRPIDPTHAGSLNRIFYGPPGTGKTYRTINAALKIADPSFYEEWKNGEKDRSELLFQFDELKKQGQIEFITFHQSFGYEEFVEGIRPFTGDEQSEQVAFEIRDGVFKRICERAASVKPLLPLDEAIEKLKIELESNPIVMKTPAQGKERTVWYEPGRESFKMQVVEAISENSQPFSISFNKLRKSYQEHEEGQKSGGGQTGPKTILNYLKKKYNLDDQQHGNGGKNYVLVIDEINRGNISKILGELITLLEDSKRIGNDEEMRATLPYSGESFGVPNNLYIIGTMNTADRSIALLDTALRRRFDFVEMMPDSELLSDLDVEGVNIQSLLNAINLRIEALYDRDHQIGHSYFMRLSEDSKIETLKDIFLNKILPLLEEYFYDDWEKINLVLNDNDFLKIKDFPPMPSSEFVDTEKKMWCINDEEGVFDKASSYQRIYDYSQDK